MQTLPTDLIDHLLNIGGQPQEITERLYGLKSLLQRAKREALDLQRDCILAGCHHSADHLTGITGVYPCMENQTPKPSKTGGHSKPKPPVKDGNT